MAAAEVPPRAQLLHLQNNKGSHTAKTGKAQLPLQSWEALAFGCHTSTNMTIPHLSSSSRQVVHFVLGCLPKRGSPPCFSLCRSLTMASIRNLLFPFVEHLSVAGNIVLKIELKNPKQHSTREVIQGQCIITEIKIWPGNTKSEIWKIFIEWIIAYQIECSRNCHLSCSEITQKH